MNAAETIAAAIEKLEAWRNAATPGPWFRDYGNVITNRPDPNDPSDEPARERVVAGVHDLRNATGVVNAALIVMLHGTIDAQLEILRRELRIQAESNGALLPRTAVSNLARAILGEAL